MPIDPGLGGWAAPVPVDPILAQERPYIEPISSGEPGYTTPLHQQHLPVYSSIPRVVQAKQQGILDYWEAYEILMTQFGLSDNEATDVLGVESATVVAEQDLTTNMPGTPGYAGFTDTVSTPEIDFAPAVNGNGNGNGGAPLFEDFQFVGLLAVIGAVYLFKKQG